MESQACVAPYSPLHICVAGLCLAITCTDASVLTELRAYYQPFLGDLPPSLTAQVDILPPNPAAGLPDLGHSGRFENQALVFSGPAGEGRIDLANNQAELKLTTEYPALEIEYFVRSAFALLLFAAGGLLFHAAGIKRNGQAYLFFGHSGSGKTTVARLSPGAQVLNDDLVALLPANGGWVAHATPFWNPTQVRPGLSQGPVAGLYRLVQDRQVYCERVGAAQALAEVIASAPVISADLGRGPELVHRGLDLLTQVPVYRLHFLPDDSFWQVVDP